MQKRRPLMCKHKFRCSSTWTTRFTRSPRSCSLLQKTTRKYRGTENCRSYQTQQTQTHQRLKQPAVTWCRRWSARLFVCEISTLFRGEKQATRSKTAVWCTSRTSIKTNSSSVWATEGMDHCLSHRLPCSIRASKPRKNFSKMCQLKV